MGQIVTDASKDPGLIVDLDQRPRIGPYILTRELGSTSRFGVSRLPHDHPSPHAPAAAVLVGSDATSAAGSVQPDRFLALHAHAQTSHVAYRFPATPTKAEERRLVAAVESCSLLENSHLLKVQQFTFDLAGQAWVITPFSGDVDGLRTLTRLMKDRGGQMTPLEVELAMGQLLEAVASAHSGAANSMSGSNSSGADEPSPTPAFQHGPIHMDEVLVDRHGSLLIELYGIAAMLQGISKPSMELMRDEVRSVVEIGYQLITGLRAEEPMIPAGRIVRGLDARWDRWLSRGLDPSTGFDTATQALAAMPNRQTDGAMVNSTGAVRGMFAKFRTGRPD